MKSTNNHINQQEGTIDYKRLLFRLAKRWYIILFSLIIGYGLCSLYLRYQENIYQVNSTILIMEDDKAVKVLGGMDMYGEKSNLRNQIGIIKSFDMVNKVLSELNFDITYHHEGSVRTVELYNDFAYKVVPDSSKLQIINVPFYITALSSNKYILEADAPNGATLYNPLRHVIEDKTAPFRIRKECTFGEPVEFNNTTFTIYLQNPYYKQAEGKTYFLIHDRNRLAYAYKNKLRVAPVDEESTILNLTISGPVYNKNIDFLNKVAEVYLQNEYEEKVQIATHTIAFLDDQIAQVVASLKHAEGEMEDFRSSHKVMNLGTTAEEAYSQLQTLENEKSKILLELKYYDYIREYITSNKEIKEMVVPSAIGIADPVLNKLIGDLIQFKAERSHLASTSTEKNPYLKALDGKIDYTHSALKESINNVINGTKVTLADINSRISNIERTVSTLPKTERMLLDIQRKFNLNDHLYNFLLEKKAEAGITKASTKIDHKILERASYLNTFKIAPKESSIKLAFLSLALFIPIIGLFLRDALNIKIKSKEDIEKKTDIPILGVIGHSGTQSNLVVHENPKSPLAEAFRAIRINMQYLNKDNNCNKVIAITSSVSGEGKTFTSINLATIIAIAGKKTVLIGGDLRKPKIINDFNLTNNKGLSTYLKGKCNLNEIIFTSQIPNLDIIPSGPIPHNPAELLQDDKMDDFIESLKKSYDFIIIDTPPVGLVADAFLFMKYSDQNIYIVRHNYTRKKMLEKVDKLYTEELIKNINIIINDLNDKDGQYGYGYSYGYYKNYGYYEEVPNNRKNLINWIKDKTKFSSK